MALGKYIHFSSNMGKDIKMYGWAKDPHTKQSKSAQLIKLNYNSNTGLCSSYQDRGLVRVLVHFTIRHSS